jgi:hypothetical protein
MSAEFVRVTFEEDYANGLAQGRSERSSIPAEAMPAALRFLQRMVADHPSVGYFRGRLDGLTEDVR